MAYNDLTAPFEGANDEWNNLEISINTEEDVYNTLTINTQVPTPEGDEWNTEM